MNNLVFNTVAEELKTTIYAQAPDASIRSLKLDASDNLLVANAAPITIANSSLTVAGTVTVSEILAPVTIANDSLTVAGTVTVSEILAPVTIANDSLTVSGTVTVSEILAPVTIANDSLTVAGTVTVSEILAPVTIANESLTVSIQGYAFTSNTATLSGVNGVGEVFDNTDISQIKTATFFVYNTGASPITISLQISPSTDSALYIDDPSYTDVNIPAGEDKIIVVGKFGNYTRLQYDLTAAADFIAYYNGQA